MAAAAREQPPDAGARAAEERGPSAYVAELVGTFLLVVFIALVLSENHAGALGFTDYSVIGLVHAFLLMMLVATLGPTSGGHFNPAVTLTLTLLRRISAIDALIYVFCQLSGAVAGALVARALLADEGQAVAYGAPQLAADGFLSGDLLAGCAAEALGTFALMWAVMGTTVNPQGDRQWAPFVIGATLGLAVFVIGPLTGAGLNPARAFGPALVAGEEGFDGAGTFLVAFVLGPLVGALLAGMLYSATVLTPRRLAARRPIDTLDGLPSGERRAPWDRRGARRRPAPGDPLTPPVERRSERPD